MTKHLKQFAVKHVPGVRKLRDARRTLLDFRAMEPQFEELKSKITRWESILHSVGVNNTALYSDILHKRFRLDSPLLKASKSQLDQDLFVAYVLQEKKNGFFVEFGATNGIELSNSYMLETQLNWHGILAEPGKSWHEKLQANRTCKIDHRCVYSRSGEVITFADAIEPELSTIEDFQGCDSHAEVRKNCEKYEVTTISLNDLLQEYGAPREIDYLSIDTEGSELEILSTFDFSQYDISVITVEHNYTDNREKIYELLSNKGFTRVLEEYSQFDDWYINESIVSKGALQ